MEEEFECPLLNRVVNEGYYYDINMVASHMIKEEVLEDKIDEEKALKICKKCNYKPF